VPSQRLALIFPATFQAFDVLLACHQSVGRVVAQTVMIVQIFVTHRQGSDALTQQLLHAVLNQTGIALIMEASGQTANRPCPQLQLAKQQRPACVAA